MISQHVFGDAEEEHDGKIHLTGRLFPRDSEYLSTEIFGRGGISCSPAEVTIDAFVTGMMNGEESFSS